MSNFDEERAAILEYEAGFHREDAEFLARALRELQATCKRYEELVTKWNEVVTKVNRYRDERGP